MDLSLSPFHFVTLDQTQVRSCLFYPPKNNQSNFFEYGFSVKNGRTMASFFAVPFSYGKGLPPKPEPNCRTVFTKSRIEDRPIIGEPDLGIIIGKLVLMGKFKEALEFFEILESREEPMDMSTCDSLVNACIALKSSTGAKRVFYYLIQRGFSSDLYINNRVLLMLLKCGLISDADRWFDEMPERNVVSWSIMVNGASNLGFYKEALGLFVKIWEELTDGDSRIFAAAIRACAGLAVASYGMQLHACTVKMSLETEIFISCALVDMYSKCGIIEDARMVFDLMPEKNVVGWNSMIAGYALNGYSEEAMDLYYEMQRASVKMDQFTYSCTIRVCARLALLEHAKQAHAGLVRNGFGLDTVANTALVDFYSRWGRIEDARRVFDKMIKPNVISWNAMIAGYGNHGMGMEAIELFKQMLSKGMKPNHVTFLAVLSACSYSGLSDQGWHYFESMSRDHKIKPRAMHYACMIELLGREGLLDQAFSLIRDAPFKPTENMWAALLTASRVHKNFELGRFAAERLIGMEPEKLANYIVLLNIYNASGREDDVTKVRQALLRRGLRLLPAFSWINIKKRSHGFLFGDKSHPQTSDIYKKLDEMMKEIVNYGYVPPVRSLLPDVLEEEDQLVVYHSEKLAVAFGLISTPEFTSLQVVQGHRICGDCHATLKLIAFVTRREIVVRDAGKFHHFKRAKCSCGDYW